MDAMSWYSEMPVVSRTYMTVAIMASLAVFLDFMSPLSLYYNLDLVLYKGQYWRLVSSFIFFGNLSVDFVFHLFFIMRYCRLLEEGHFRGRTADFIWMFVLGAAVMLALAVSVPMFSKIRFLGHSLSFMLVYVWGRDPENEDMRMNFLGLFPFNAPYLPWVLLLFSVVIGNPVETDLLGIVVGHLYYFLDSVWPRLAHARGWTYWSKVLVTPSLLTYLCSPRQRGQGQGIDIVPAPAAGMGMEDAPRPGEGGGMLLR